MDRFEQIISIRRQLRDIYAKRETKMAEDGEMVNNCWDGYEPIGTKILDGREVPNCVPIKENMGKIKKEGFPIPSPSGDEDEQTYVSRCIGEISGEYEQDVAAAICYSKWREK